MSDLDRQTHWEHVYATKDEQKLSWFQDAPALSLDLIRATGVSSRASIVEIGGGASRLPDVLLDAGFGDITVLDLSDSALAIARARLGARGLKVKWTVADVTTWRPPQTYDVWHDRAAFHFLTDPQDRAAYAARVAQAVAVGGHVIIGTFAPDGPERCSGLPVVRHDATSISRTLGRGFDVIESRTHDHVTPGGTIQRFQFSRLRRMA